MSQSSNPCRFVHIREPVSGPNGVQNHVVATVALIPHKDRDSGEIKGVGIGISYRSPTDCPCYKAGRRRALKRASTAIAKNKVEGFYTAPLPYWADEKKATFKQPVLAGAYIQASAAFGVSFRSRIPFGFNDIDNILGSINKIFSKTNRD